MANIKLTQGYFYTLFVLLVFCMYIMVYNCVFSWVCVYVAVFFVCFCCLFGGFVGWLRFSVCLYVAFLEKEVKKRHGVGWGRGGKEIGETERGASVIRI